MPPENRNSRDLAITPGHYALVLDRTKGCVETFVGPCKTSLADTQSPVKFSPETPSGYNECDTSQSAVQPYVTARRGQYVVLSNPALDNKHPDEGKSCMPPALETGNVINIPGPVTFAVWWQQTAEVIDGHQLRSNQYVVVEITNEKQARESWGTAVSEFRDEKQTYKLEPKTLTMGQRIIIRGTEISFFIPPTGARVVPDPKTKTYVREAVTLESQQYCVLLSESGNKRFVKGPDVVFPTSTETFVEAEDGSREFKCVQLNPNSGIHVMVIADYNEGSDDPLITDIKTDTKTDVKTVKAGTELFITGKDTPIYYPRAEHAIIKYDNNIIHYATAVPEGEGRYVLNKLDGKVELRTGPDMMLLDPTKFVFVRRVLSPRQASLYFPGNCEVAQANADMAQSAKARGGASYLSGLASGLQDFGQSLTAAVSYTSSLRSVAADTVERKSSYTAPRTLTLDTKYQGAIPITVWPGYAVQVVKKSGDSRVVAGPKTVLLEYDEELTRLALSTGKPKNTDTLYETVYLKLSGNQVSDIVRVESLDGFEFEVKISLQIKFSGEPSLWFTVDNYVKQVCDQVRSRLRGAAKRVSVLDFSRDAVSIIRDTVLGVKSEDKKRLGLSFENGASVYDVEILGVKITDPTVASTIYNANREVAQSAVEVIKATQKAATVKALEACERTVLAEKLITAAKRHETVISDAERRSEVQTVEQELQANAREAADQLEIARQEALLQIQTASLKRSKDQADQEIAEVAAKQKLAVELMAAQTQAIQTRLASVDAKLVAAIQASNDREMLVQAVEQLGLAAYLKNDSVGATLSSLLAGTPLAGCAAKLGEALRG